MYLRWPTAPPRLIDVDSRALAHVALRLASVVCATFVRTGRSSNSSSRPSTSSLDTTDRISPECADPLLERASS
jgi:hypothetical protein